MLSPDQFGEFPVGYHGTRYRLKPGTILEGGKMPSNQGAGTPGDHVYYAREPYHAGIFAGYAHGPDPAKTYEPHVYAVRPLDDPEPDPDEDPSVGSYRSRRVQVVRPVGKGLWMHGFQESGEAWKA
jgi:hypothetical protein